MRDGDDSASAGFAALVERQAAIYFDELLPRYIARWYRGAGYSFAVQQLAALDDDTFDQPLADRAPPGWARRRAARVRRNCPLVVQAQAPARPAMGVLLGQFLSQESYVRHSAVHTQTLEHWRRVEIYEDGFRALAPASDEALAREILKTIVHEYLHFFESFLLRREQALRGREEWDGAVQRITPEEATRRDRRITWRRRLWRGLLAAAATWLLASLLWFGTDLHRVAFREDPRRLAALAVDRAQLFGERDRLARTASAPEAARRELAEIEAEIAAFRSRAATLAPDRVLAALAPVVAPATIRPLGYAPGVELTGPRGGAGAAAALDRAARELPSLEVGPVSARGGTFSVVLSPPAASDRPLPAPRHTDRAREAPVFASDAGDALREDVRRLEAEIEGLRRDLGPLADLSARRGSLARLRAAAWEGDAAGQAACLLVAAASTALGREDGAWMFSADRALFVGSLLPPVRIVDAVDCPGGRWELAGAQEMPGVRLERFDDVSLDYRFSPVPAPRPWGVESPRVTLTKLLPPKASAGD